MYDTVYIIKIYFLALMTASIFVYYFALQDRIALNLYGLMFLQREQEEKEGIQFFIDATQQRKDRQRKKRKREKAARRAILSI